MQNDDLVAPKIMGYGRLYVPRGVGYGKFDCATVINQNIYFSVS